MALEEVICSSVRKLWTSLEWRPWLSSKSKSCPPSHSHSGHSFYNAFSDHQHPSTSVGMSLLWSGSAMKVISTRAFLPCQTQIPWEQELFLLVCVPISNSRCSVNVSWMKKWMSDVKNSNQKETEGWSLLYLTWKFSFLRREEAVLSKEDQFLDK